MEVILPEWVRMSGKFTQGLKGMRRHVSGEESLSISSGNKNYRVQKIQQKA